MTFRQSFSVEIIKCNREINKWCKNDSDISKLLKQFYFTYYIVQQRVEFVDDNLNQNPLITQNLFHSQFVLNLDRYRDNNNFLRVNNVETNDHRWNFVARENEYEFVDYVMNPIWESSSEYWNINMTRGDPYDNATYNIER